jgi:hypothetical protein
MIHHSMVTSGKTWRRVTALGLTLMLLGGCDENRLDPSAAGPTAGDPVAAAPIDSTALPADSTSTDTTGVTTLAGSVQPGIVFGTINMSAANLNTVQAGLTDGGGLTPTNVLPLLATAQAKGARVILKMSMGRDSYIKNPDGTFSLSKWKSLVDRFKNVNLTQYINDGTLLGHFLIDEPHRTVRWGGKIISQATIEEMAKYSKLLWPNMATFARVVPSWLATAPVTYTHLDAGWLQYAAGKGDAAKMVAAEVAAAKTKRLGLMVGLNVLAGGNGSSKFKEWSSGWAMSAAELKSYGTTLLNQSYVCGFYNWMWDDSYYARADIKSAMAALSSQARVHARTSCRQ